jgi:hypothetical protein
MLGKMRTTILASLALAACSSQPLDTRAVLACDCVFSDGGASADPYFAQGAGSCVTRDQSEQDCASLAAAITPETRWINGCTPVPTGCRCSIIENGPDCLGE